jgi:maleylacetate reductase
VIVRWGLSELGRTLHELGVERALLVTSARFAALDLPVDARFVGVRRHAPLDTAAAAADAAQEADGVVGVGGGSAIDTAKAVSAARGLPLVAVPTTYAGAEWTRYFGLRDETRGLKTGGTGANTAAVVYEPRLTLNLPRSETVGTALNALAHCAEALYTGECEDAYTGARCLGLNLPAVAANGRDLELRRAMLEGAMYAGRALAERGLYLAHAMAQALGGRYGVPHGAMNALCLPPVLRFNQPTLPDAIARFGQALEAGDPSTRIEELARLDGFERLRDFGIPEADLSVLADEAAARPGARANPRPAGAEDVLELLRSIW